MKPNRLEQIRKIGGWILFLVLTVGTLAKMAELAVRRRVTGREVASLQQQRDHLQEIVDRRKAEPRQGNIDKRLVIRLMQQCRVVEDIPNLQSNRIVSIHHGYGDVFLYVPEGSHTLEITIAWKPRELGDLTADPEVTDDRVAGQKMWSVPLQAPGGYMLDTTSDRDGGPITWELTSHHPDFAVQKGTIPLVGFSQQGGSWSTSDIFAFPNQVQGLTRDQLTASIAERSGVKLMLAALHGRVNEQDYEVTVSCRLISEGPACVAASDAVTLIVMGLDEFLMPYQGDGKYGLKDLPPVNSTLE